MTQPIDTAYVEIKGRGLQNTAREVAALLRAIARDVERTSKQINEDLEDAFDGVHEQLALFEIDANKTLSSVGKEAKETGAELGASIAAGAEVAEAAIDDLADEAVSDLERIDRQIAETRRNIHTLAVAFARGNRDVVVELNSNRGLLRQLMMVRRELAGMGDDADRTFRTMTSGANTFVNTLEKMASAFSIQGLVMLTLVAALVPILLPLIGALADLGALVLLLPAGIGALVAAIAPLIVSFQGMGEAVEALASGDLEKINEALKNLSPSARAVARELNSLRKPLNDLKKAVQESFFAPLRGEFSLLLNKLLPTLRSGMSTVAREFGEMFESIMRMLGTERVRSSISGIFNSLARILDRLTPKLTDFLETLIRFADQSMPFLERMGDAFGKLLGKMSEWLDESMRTGEFNKLLDDAFATLESILGLAGAIWKWFTAIFGNLGDEGRVFIDMLADLFRDWAEFFASEDGQRLINDLVQQMPAIMMLIKGLSELLQAAAPYLHLFTGEGIGNGLERLGEGIEKIGKAIGDWGSGIVDWFKDAWKSIQDFNDAAGEAIIEAWDKVVQFFKDLPKTIGDFLTSLANQFFVNVGRIIGIVIFAFTELPNQIWQALQQLPGIVWSVFTDTWNTAVAITMGAAAAVIAWVDNMRTKALEFISELPGKVADWFARTWQSAREETQKGVNDVVAWIRDVPNKLRNLVSDFVDAGYRLIKGFFEGLSRTGSFLTNIGRAIANAIRNQINNVIYWINKGISDVDRFLPGTLPRLPYIPMLARGGMVTGFTFAGLGEGGRSEVVLPLEDPRTLQSLRHVLEQAMQIGNAPTVTTMSSGGTGIGSGITIHQLTIPITGVWDMTDPIATRKIAVRIVETIENVRREYA